MSDNPSIDEVLNGLLKGRSWREDEIRVKVFVQSIAAFNKKAGFITEKQEAALRRVWDVHQKRVSELSRGVNVSNIPDDYFEKTAQRRKGHPRNGRPYNKTYDD